MKFKNMYNKKFKILHFCLSLAIFLDALFETLLSLSLSGGLFFTNSIIVSILFHSFLIFVTIKSMLGILKSEIIITDNKMKFYDFSKIWITQISFNDIEKIYAIKNTEANNSRYEKDSVLIYITTDKKHVISISDKDYQRLLRDGGYFENIKNTEDG